MAAAVLVTLLLCALGAASRTSAPRAAGVAAAIALASVVPVGLVAYEHFATPLGAVGAPMHAVGVVFAVVGVMAALAIGGAYLATSRRADGARSVASWVAVAVGVAVFVLSATRARGGNPEAYARSVPVSAALVPGGAPTTVGAATLAVRTDPADGKCKLTSATPGRVAVYPLSTGALGHCPTVRVRHDARDDVAIIELLPLCNARPSNDSAWSLVDVISTADGKAVTRDAHTARHFFDLPPLWTSSAAISAALALVLLFVARRSKMRAAMLASLDDAIHEGDGWFVLDDGGRVRVAEAADEKEGAFTVRVADRGDRAGYRSSAAAAVEPVAPGQKLENVTNAIDLAGSCEGIALTAVAIGSMPALVALAAMT